MIECDLPHLSNGNWIPPVVHFRISFSSFFFFIPHLKPISSIFKINSESDYFLPFPLLVKAIIISCLDSSTCLAFVLWLLALPRRRQWHPTPVLLPGKSHGRRSLVALALKAGSEPLAPPEKALWLYYKRRTSKTEYRSRPWSD